MSQRIKWYLLTDEDMPLLLQLEYLSFIRLGFNYNLGDVERTKQIVLKIEAALKSIQLKFKGEIVDVRPIPARLEVMVAILKG